MQIVPAAPELDVLNDSLSSVGVRPHVVELKEASLGTSTVCSNEGANDGVALAEIQTPDVDLDEQAISRAGPVRPSRWREGEFGQRAALY